MSVSEIKGERCHACGHLLRGTVEPEQPAALVTGPLSIDFRSCRVRVDGSDMALTPQEYRLLAFLARRAGEVVPWQEIADHLMFPGYYDGFTAGRGARRNYAARSTVHRLRKRLGAAAGLIEARLGIGLILRTELIVTVPDPDRLDAFIAWAEADPDERVNERSMAAFVAGWQAAKGEQS